MSRPRAIAFAACMALLGGSATWDPSAIQVHPVHQETVNADAVAALVADGRALFVTKFNLADGMGRPGATGDSKPTPRDVGEVETFTRLSGPDAMSCHGCHNQPAVGGSGDFAVNVFVGSHFLDMPGESIGAEVTSERNTTTIAGAGLIELLAREMSSELQATKAAAVADAAASGQPVRVHLETKGVSFGHLTVRGDTTLDASELEGLDLDQIVRPFGVKGIAASLREFTIAALNQHHGIQAIERFGWERTGSHDFDGDGVEVEFSPGQVTAMVVFQAALSPPQQRWSSGTAGEKERAGFGHFEAIGCSTCHIPSLPLEGLVFTEPGPFNRPGALAPEDGMGLVHLDLSAAAGHSRQVRAYSDLKRHNLCDEEIRHFCNEKLRQDNVSTELFLTAELWDLASSAPYGHRGDLSTLSEAILAHGGEARDARERFLDLPDDDKRDLIAFLLTLGREDLDAQGVVAAP